jgi:hypothetical protein
MLLRDTNPSDFRVPAKPGRTIAADDAKAKGERAGDEALHRRDERDAGLALAHERARVRAELFKMFAEEERPAGGLVARADQALKAYKSKSGALRGEDLKALERDVRGHALRLEATARARDRVQQAGKTLDVLIAATRTAPQNFAAHAETARSTVESLKLPAKVAEAFRARLSEIPEAAIAALIERDPAQAAQLLKSREGPARAEHGLDRATRKLLTKQAEAAAAQAEHGAANDANVRGLRAHADAANAIDAAGRGEGDEAGLTAWLAGSDAIGEVAMRDLRRKSKAAAKTVAKRKAAIAAAREALARGEPPADDEGLDGVYASLPPRPDREGTDAAFVEAAGKLPAALVRRIAADLKSADPDRALNAAQLVVALEEKSERLVARLPASLRSEAHRLSAAAAAGLTAADARRHLHEAADRPSTERDRYAEIFDRTIDGATLVRAIEQVFAITAVGIAA